MIAGVIAIKEHQIYSISTCCCHKGTYYSYFLAKALKTCIWKEKTQGHSWIISLTIICGESYQVQMSQLSLQTTQLYSKIKYACVPQCRKCVDRPVLFLKSSLKDLPVILMRYLPYSNQCLRSTLWSKQFCAILYCHICNISC